MKRFIAAIVALALVLAFVPALAFANSVGPNTDLDLVKEHFGDPVDDSNLVDSLEYARATLQTARAAAPVAAPKTGAISLVGFGLVSLAGLAGAVAVKSKRK